MKDIQEMGGCIYSKNRKMLNCQVQSMILSREKKERHKIRNEDKQDKKYKENWLQTISRKKF